MDVNIIIIVTGAALMAVIWIGFLTWGILTKQFKDNDYLKNKPLEDDEQ